MRHDPLREIQSQASHGFVRSNTTGFPEVIHANINDAAQSVTVQALYLATDARDTYDGDRTAYPGASLTDTVSYVGLSPGTKYTARVEWHLTDGATSLGSTGLTATKTFFAIRPVSGP